MINDIIKIEKISEYEEEIKELKGNNEIKF